MTNSPSLTRAQAPAQDGFKILVFSRTTPSGYRHASIEAGMRGIKRLAKDVSRQSSVAKSNLQPFNVTATEDAAVFDDLSELGQYRVILLLSNSGDDCLDEGQLSNFRKWVEAGGGVVGVHCAGFCCIGPGPGQKWYGDALGGVFADHPVPQDGVVRVVAEDILGPGDGGSEGTGADDKTAGDSIVGHVKSTTKEIEPVSHPIHICGQIGMEYLVEAGWSTSRPAVDFKGQEEDHMSEDAISERKRRTARHVADEGRSLQVGTSLHWHDEWYNFVSQPREKLLLSRNNGKTENCTVLLKVDESTYSGGKHGKDHPVAWCQEFKTGAGRCFYTALGHFDEAYEDPWFMGHLLGGIYWAAKVC